MLRGQVVWRSGRALLSNGGARSSTLVVVATLAASAFALGRDVAIGRHFGLGPNLDAWTIGIAIVAFATSAVTTSLNSALVPAILSNPEDEDRLLAGSLLAVLGVGVAIAVAAWSLRGAVAQLVAPGRSAEALTGTLSVFALAAPVLLIRAVATAALHARRRFVVPSGTSSMAAISVLALLVTTIATSVRELAAAHVVGLVAEALLLVVLVKPRVRPGLVRLASIAHAVRVVGRHSSVAFGAALAASANPLVDAWFAARRGEGEAGRLVLSGRIPIAVAALLSIGIATPAFPRFVDAFHAGGATAVDRAARRLVRLSLPLVLVPTMLLITLSVPLAQLIYAGGGISTGDARSIGLLTLTYSFTVVPYVATVLFHRVLHASGLEVAALKIAIVGVLVNICANWLLGMAFGLYGIAISTAIVYAVSAGCMAIATKRSGHNLPAEHG